MIKIDQEALKHLGHQVIQTLEKKKWLPKLLGCDFSIEFKLGKENTIVDALLRSFMVFSSMQSKLKIQIQQL